MHILTNDLKPGMYCPWTICFMCTNNFLMWGSFHKFSDIIMDMLGDRKMRKIVNTYYEDSGEPKLVRKAVDEAWRKEQMFNSESIEIDGQNTLSAKLKTLRYVL